MRTFRLLSQTLWLAWACSCLAAPDLVVKNLRCDFAVEPIGIDSPTPQLSWIVESSTRGQRQTAYRVLAASSAQLLASDKGDLWDSGKVRSDATSQIGYGGKPLQTSQQVFWKVRSWDKDGKASDWSPTTTWTMGVLREEDWHAKWIGASAAKRNKRERLGYHTDTTRNPDEVKWVQVDLGRSLRVSAVRLIPMNHAGKKGFGFPVRFKVELANEPEFKQPILIADQTGSDYPNPGITPVTFETQGKQGRYVRVTSTRLWKRDEMYCFALCQMAVMAGETNLALGAAVSAKDSVEAYGWGQVGLTDGLCGLPEKEPEPQTLMLRREFVVRPGLRRAVAHVSGMGCYEMSVNGKKVGDALFPPGWSKYDRTCLYDSYDVTEQVQEGRNAAGLLLGNGMYNVVGGRYTKFKDSFGPLKAIGQIRLEYENGRTEVIGTDARWRYSAGPITFSCVFGGEDYDARLEPAGWSEPDFDDSKWTTALTVDGPGGQLKGLSCAAPPIRAFEVLKPVKVTEIRPGVTVYDLGQNASLMPQLKTHGAAGSVVKIIPAELIREDGTVDRSSCGGGSAYWQYTLAGKGEETWFPKFYYHGSRYLQVERQAPAGAELPVVDALEGVVIHADCEPAGEFGCSNELFNRIRTLVRWAQRSNMMSVMTDCPHREKLGWLEEDHLNGPALRYEFQLERLFTKIMNDMADSQLDNGLVPDIAPEYVQFRGGFRDSPEWGSACILVPWQQYLFTGDLELMRRYYPRMEDYVAYLGNRATNHIVSHGLGDWYDIGPNPPGVAQLTPIALTATAFYYYDTWVLGQAAELLGKKAEAARYSKLAEQIRAAFNREFFNAETGKYATGSQAANAIGLVMGFAEADQAGRVLENIVEDVRARGNSLTAGDVGYRYLLRGLADGGRSDVIFDINNQSEKPGYGYQLKMGATSLTEAWDARRQSSHNHFMLGQITEWFYHDLAGIQPDPAQPGFKRVVIKPAVVGDVQWVKAAYQSVYGTIRVHWRRSMDEFVLEAVVPANARAVVHVPGAPGAETTESGRPARRSPDVEARGEAAGAQVFEVGSGSYEFRRKL